MPHLRAVTLGLLLPASGTVLATVPDGDDYAALPLRRLDETSYHCSGGSLCGHDKPCATHADCEKGWYCNSGHSSYDDGAYNHNDGGSCAFTLPQHFHGHWSPFRRWLALNCLRSQH